MPDGTSPAAAEAGGGGKFGPLLEELRAFIPRALIGDSGWAGLLGRVGGLPEEGVASSCGFEFRLDDASPAADFFVVIRPGEPLAHYYIGRESADGADAAAAALARHLVRMDPDAGPSRGDSVAGWNDGMTLEYDVAEVEGNGRPAPGVFLRMRLTRSPERKDPHHCHPRTAVAGIAAAVGWEPDEEERGAVERAFGALPAGSEVAHIGGLPGRRPRAVRLLIQRIERTEVPDFLERVQWPGAAGGVVSVLNDFGNIYRRFRLSVDLSARGTAPRLGVEMFVGDDWDREDDWLNTDIGQWRPMVERLEARGLCLPEKARGLLAWPVGQQLYGTRGVYHLYMGINHVKLLIEHGAIRAKAYTGLHCAPVRPRGDGGTPLRAEGNGAEGLPWRNNRSGAG